MAEQIANTYNYTEVVSKLTDEGWSHSVDGKEFATLAEAIKHAKVSPMGDTHSDEESPIGDNTDEFGAPIEDEN